MLDTVQEDTMHVLVIEDDIEMASFIEKVLVEAGHRVDMATDGDSGLAMARASEFDALVVDRMLPEKDGLTLVKEYREDADPLPVSSGRCPESGAGAEGWRG